MNKNFLKKKISFKKTGAVFILLILIKVSTFFIPDPGLYPSLTWSRAYTDEKGRLLRLTLTEDEKYRLFTPLKEISPYLENLVLQYEDRYFYHHPGFNPFSLLRGFADTYILKKRSVGGSTITMQTARMRFKINSRTIPGKINQILRAVQLEIHYSKKEILEAYFNLAPYGGNIEGAGCASLIYFHKKAGDLNFSEAASLAVIPQNPAARNPKFKKGRKKIRKAGKRLVEIWNENQAEKPCEFMEIGFFRKKDLGFKGEHFIDWLEKNPDLPESRILRTTLDLELQEIIQGKLSKYVEKKRSIGILNGSVLLLDFKTMEIKAMVGSKDYYDDGIFGQVNGCISKRSPGSTLKPFVYGLAIDQGFIHPHTLLRDAPASFSGFTPGNYDGNFEGPVFAGDALIRSRNLPAVNLAQKINSPDLYDFLKKSEVTELKEKAFYGLSLVLGGGEVTMLELAKLYSILGNLGELKDVKYLKDQKKITKTKRLLSRESAFMVNTMLAKNPPMETLILKERDRLPVSWKTGTSYGFRDAWAAGVFGDYVLCVWIGNFSGKGNPSFVGRLGAGPLFFDIVEALNNKKNLSSHMDETKVYNVKKVDVCSVSGKLPGKYTPHTIKTWFIPGVSPIEVSNLHRMVYVDKKSGKRLCRKEPGAKQEIFQFWPTDMKRLFEKGGIYIKTPPPFKENNKCIKNSDSGIPPLISSPVPGVEYIMEKNSKIAFKASGETGIKKLYWFVDSVYEGDSKPDDVFLWKPVTGNHFIRVIDDLGRMDYVEINVVNN